MFKSGILIGGIGAIGLYFTGALTPGYSRVVQGSPDAVMAALEDLDITQQPGSPGTDPSRSGGVKPMFRLAKGANAMTWYVMSGDQVATRMTATLEPVNGGTETRVGTVVERGDAPDDRVSPAFRSQAITLGLFNMAVEGELDRLTNPVTRSQDECRAMAEELLLAGASDGLPRGGAPTNLTQAMGQTAKDVMRLAAMEKELQRRGCDTNAPAGEFRPVSNEMVKSDPGDLHRPAITTSSGRDENGISFEPGKPMVDVSRK